MVFLQQVFPLLLVLFLSGAFSFGGNSNSLSEHNYTFSYQQSNYYPVHVLTYRLKKSYFVHERTAFDLRADSTLKKRVRSYAISSQIQLDERVERDLVRKAQGLCEEAKKKRQEFISLAKQAGENSFRYEDYLNVSQIRSKQCRKLKLLTYSLAMTSKTTEKFLEQMNYDINMDY